MRCPVKYAEDQIVSQEELLRQSDFVSLHVRSEPSTERMMGRRELALMKPSSFLINTARLELVDEAALAEALIAGRLAGAAIDDPPTDENLLS